MNPPSSDIKIQSLFLRAIAQKSQRKTAENIGVHESALSRWLAGEGGLKFDQICRLMAALNIEPEYLGDGGTGPQSRGLAGEKGRAAGCAQR